MFSLHADDILPPPMIDGSRRHSVEETWEDLSPKDKFVAMYGTTPEAATPDTVMTHIAARFNTHAERMKGLAEFDMGSYNGEMELNRVVGHTFGYVDRFSLYQTQHVEPAARTLRRGIEAAQPFVDESLGFLLDLAFGQRTTDHINTIRSTWPVSERPTIGSISPRQKNILQGNLTLRQAAKL